ncbi:hypothetical protein D3C71_1320330 [compost metagenome]
METEYRVFCEHDILGSSQQECASTRTYSVDHDEFVLVFIQILERAEHTVELTTTTFSDDDGVGLFENLDHELIGRQRLIDHCEHFVSEYTVSDCSACTASSQSCKCQTKYCFCDLHFVPRFLFVLKQERKKCSSLKIKILSFLVARC